MRVLSFIFAAVLFGCLPSYSNNVSHAPDGGGGDGNTDVGCGIFVTGFVVSIEQALLVSGPQVHIDGASAQFTSPPADDTGAFQFEISCTISQSSTPRYLIVDGSSKIAGVPKPVIPTWIAPARLFNANHNEPFLHFYENEDNMMGLRTALAQALAMHGDIPSAADFPTQFTMTYGPLAFVDETGIDRYNGYSVQVIDQGVALDNTNCMPTQQCCVYYLHADYPEWLLAVQMAMQAGTTPPSFVNFGATQALGEFHSVVCPVQSSAVPNQVSSEVTLHQTQPIGMLRDRFGQAPTSPFSDIVVPRVLGGGVHVEWWIQ